MKKSASKVSPPPPTPAQRTPTRDEVSTTAEALWRRMGCPEGRDNEIWFAAERALSKRGPAFDDTEINDELDALFPDTDRGSPTAL
jgi:hypothetical protein